MANDGFPPTRADGRNVRKGHSKTDPAAVGRTLELMPKAAALRAAGASFRDIGQSLGIDPTWARTLVLKALQEVAYEAADEMRTQEGERLDRLQMGLWPQATRGDVKAVLAVVRVMERRAKLFGLDAPVKLEVAEVVDYSEVDEALSVILGTLAPDSE